VGARFRLPPAAAGSIAVVTFYLKVRKFVNGDCAIARRPPRPPHRLRHSTTAITAITIATALVIAIALAIALAIAIAISIAIEKPSH
jgi:hypothetical protein